MQQVAFANGEEGTLPAVRPTGSRLLRAALTGGTLEEWSRIEEDSVSLEPWRLAICGDFVRARSCPAEAAGLSGLEAGDCAGAWFQA